MKNISNYAFLIIALTIASCQKEQFNVNSFEEQLNVNSIEQQSNTEGIENSTRTVYGSTLYYTNIDLFNEDACATLTYEDFAPSNPLGNLYWQGIFFSPLDENTNSPHPITGALLYNTGDIVPGLSLEAGNDVDYEGIGTLHLYNWGDSPPYFLSTLYYAPESPLIVNFSAEDVNTVGFYLGKQDSDPGNIIMTCKIELFGTDGSLIETYYQDAAQASGSYFGVISEEPIAQITIESLDEVVNTESITELRFGVCELLVTDSDNDGCLDDEDSIVNSNMEPTIVIEGCDTGVSNDMTSECGVTMSDLIDELEEGTYKNHGGFISTLVKLLNDWVAEGILSMEDKDLIMACAAQSSIGQ